MKDFYVTLFSNSSMNYYTENKTSSFTVQLPRSMILNGEWDVALTEIQYPYSFFNVLERNNEIKIKIIKITEKFIDFVKKGKVTLVDIERKKEFKSKSVSCKIQPGFYDNIETLISSVNSVIHEKTNNENFFIRDNTSQRVHAQPSPVAEGNIMILSVMLCERLALQLGYTPKVEITESNMVATHVANLISGIPDKMLIYCDIIEPQIIGDKCAKVLRTVTLTPDGSEPYFGKPCCKDFTQLQYVPLQKKHFDSINIDIRDITGNLVPFQFQTSSVKLHFKQN